MSASGAGGGCGGPGPGPGPGLGGSAPGAGSGPSNPRKFSEKIALHTQRQAEETAAFQEVMMDISSTRAQKRLARNQGPYYGGSLPDVNQIGRNHQDFQGSFSSTLESSRSTRHHGLVERVQRDRRFVSPVRPYRNRQMDNSAYNPAYLSPPPDPSWRRTNSDSALHTSVMNPPTGDPFSSGHSLTPQTSRRAGQTEGEGRRMFPIFPSPEQPSSTTAHLPPPALNTGGSLPDLSSLHFPSPLPTPLDNDEPGYLGAASLSGGNSTGNLTSTLTQLGITTANGPGHAFHQHTPGLLASLQSALSHPSLHSSLSNPNIQSSLSSHSFPNSLSSTSLHSSLSNPSLQSSLSSSPSLPSSLSSQSLHSSLSNSSLSGQSVTSNNPSYSSAMGGSSSCNPSYSPLLSGQGQPPLSTSPRRRAQLSPLILPMGGEGRRHPSKQFSPTISPTLSSITQGVPLDTSKLPLDQRLPPYPFNQQLHPNHQNHQQQLHQNHHAHQSQGACQQQRPASGLLDPTSAPLIKSEIQLDQCDQSTQGHADPQRPCGLMQLQQINQSLAPDLGLYNGSLELPELGHQQQLFNLHHYGSSDPRHTVPNIILTGGSPPGLSKEITSALSHVPGFEMDPFSLDDPLRMDPLALDMLEGDLMLADPAIEDSFRSDRLK
ncbi:hypothetical protein CRUP_028513 [Coryphaenoides rupestris]|nr:hypothetical protein CRUP_028513 [Coryphaenoides rupestris]